jgi:hypothetical protein
MNSWRSYGPNVFQIGGEIWTGGVKQILTPDVQKNVTEPNFKPLTFFRQTFVRIFYEKCYENPSISYGLQILTVPTNEEFCRILPSCDRAASQEISL